MALALSDASLEEREGILRDGMQATQGDPIIARPLVQLLFWDKKDDEALPLLEGLTRSSPHLPGVWAQLASYAISKGDFKAAAEYEDRALALCAKTKDPVELVDVYLNLFPLGKKQEGLNLLNKLVRKHPNHPFPYVVTAQVIEDDDPERAKALIEEARLLWGRRANFDEFLKDMRLPPHYLGQEQPE